MEEKSFVNSWGYSEKYICKKLIMDLSGHLNRGSSFYSSDSCGNCDGARCEQCRNIYKVYVYDEPILNEKEGYTEIKVRISKIFYELDEALEFYNKY